MAGRHPALSRLDGRWEMSKDGETWNLDFELSYVRG
jgi:hypothetical protein